MIKILILSLLILLVNSYNYARVARIEGYRCFIDNDDLYIDGFKTLINYMNIQLNHYSVYGISLNYTIINTEIIRTNTEFKTYYIGYITYIFSCQLDSSNECYYSQQYSVRDVC